MGWWPFSRAYQGHELHVVFADWFTPELRTKMTAYDVCNDLPNPSGGWCCRLEKGHAGQHDDGHGKSWWGRPAVADGRHLMENDGLGMPMLAMRVFAPSVQVFDAPPGGWPRVDVLVGSYEPEHPNYRYQVTGEDTI